MSDLVNDADPGSNKPEDYVPPTGALKVHKYAQPVTDEQLTLCGIAPGPGPISCASNDDSVTCQKCLDIIERNG